MPHQVHQRKFGRKTDLRRKMLRNLTTSVLRYERVKTTEAKAKEIRGFVDRMINLGKDGSLDARRRATAWIDEPIIVEKVFADLARRYADRASGYLRMTRLARRVGDNSPLALLELMPGVDEAAAAAAAEEKPRRRRLTLRRGGGEKAAVEPAKATKTTDKNAARTTAPHGRKKTAPASTRGRAKPSSKED